MLEDLTCRIEGLSTVHSLLSASGWRPLDVHELCRQVIDAALKGIPIGKEVDVKVGTSRVKIGSSQAHHLTLVINELATNSMKYAFDGRDRMVIQVAIEKMDGKVRIEFRDDGPGYPEKILSGDPTPTRIGFDLIKGITQHSLDGTVDFTNDNGACAMIVFKNELNSHSGGEQL
jgi:two-component sensor histidine kinase